MIWNAKWMWKYLNNSKTIDQTWIGKIIILMYWEKPTIIRVIKSLVRDKANAFGLKRSMYWIGLIAFILVYCLGNSKGILTFFYYFST